MNSSPFRGCSHRNQTPISQIGAFRKRLDARPEKIQKYYIFVSRRRPDIYTKKFEHLWEELCIPQRKARRSFSRPSALLTLFAGESDKRSASPRSRPPCNSPQRPFSRAHPPRIARSPHPETIAPPGRGFAADPRPHPSTSARARDARPDRCAPGYPRCRASRRLSYRRRSATLPAPCGGAPGRVAPTSPPRAASPTPRG